jgi:ATP-dependent Clp protease ATP-binding subunit ClpB
MRAQWEAEKRAIGEVRAVRERIEELRRSMEAAERAHDLERAARLRHGELPQLEAELAAKESALENRRGEIALLREEVTEDEVAHVVARWTGIPVTRLIETEREKLLKLESILHERVVGQDEAVGSVSDAVMRARAGLKDPRRPIGSFLFLGPTGVGKTELAKTLAAALFDSEDNLIRIDMSEYMEKHAVSRLLGAPPGYVGYDEGGQLTEAVRRRPYSVLLFDEVEKAHPDVFHVLLQLLDDGRLTDAQGRTVDFKNTVVILTSNIGSPHLLEGIGTDGAIRPEARDAVLGELRRHFRPEFLNRIDETVLFTPLSVEQIERIVDLLMVQLGARLRERGIELTLTREARSFLARSGYDPVYGARPLRRFLQRRVETALARRILAGRIPEGAAVTVGLRQGELTFEVAPEAAAAS